MSSPSVSPSPSPPPSLFSFPSSLSFPLFYFLLFLSSLFGVLAPFCLRHSSFSSPMGILSITFFFLFNFSSMGIFMRLMRTSKISTLLIVILKDLLGFLFGGVIGHFSGEVIDAKWVIGVILIMAGAKIISMEKREGEEDNKEKEN